MADNNTAAWVTVGVLAAAGIGGLVYYESKHPPVPTPGLAQQNCQNSGGTWNSATKTCTCPSGTTLDPTSGMCVTPSPSTPSPPTGVTVGNIQTTGVDSWTATGSWALSQGATSYQPLLDGAAYGNPVTGTSVQLHGTGVNQQHSFAVAACN